MVGLAVILMTKYFNRPVWASRWGKRITIFWASAATISVLLWWGAARLFEDYFWVDTTMRLIAAALIVGLIGLIVTLPLSGTLNGIDRLVAKLLRRSSGYRPEPEQIENLQDGNESQIDTTRRSLLRLGAIGLPLVAVSSSQGGVVRSFSDVRTYEKTLTFDNLPSDLDGFRILHLCDLHLGIFFHLHDFETLMTDIDGQTFDVVAVVGDVADNLAALPAALNMIANIPSRYGHYATLGNHEYYRGIRAVRRIYSQSTVPLLVDEGASFRVGQTTVHVGGADDPVSMGWSSDRESFYQHTIDAALGDSSSSDFRILLSHRPAAFALSQDGRADLTLSGHTHGGQLGLMGRSVFELFGDNLYLWGEYGDTRSRLYTSSGVGHWFPFRLGCPAEAPIITLRRS